MDRIALGKMGEEAVAFLIAGRGDTVLTRNYRSPYGEVDIISKNEEFLIFTEVKTRTGKYFGNPGEAVTRIKRRHIMETAQHFMLQNTWMLQPRFDVAEVYVCRSKSGDRVQRIRIISSAFEAEE